MSPRGHGVCGQRPLGHNDNVMGLPGTANPNVSAQRVLRAAVKQDGKAKQVKITPL